MHTNVKVISVHTHIVNVSTLVQFLPNTGPMFDSFSGVPQSSLPRDQIEELEHVLVQTRHILSALYCVINAEIINS